MRLETIKVEEGLSLASTIRDEKENDKWATLLSQKESKWHKNAELVITIMMIFIGVFFVRDKTNILFSFQKHSD